MRNSLLHSQKIYDPNDSALLSEQEHCMERLYERSAQAMLRSLSTSSL